jgi:hypothetical protein
MPQEWETDPYVMLACRTAGVKGLFLLNTHGETKNTADMCDSE